MSGDHQNLSITSPLQTGQGRGNMMKGSWLEIRTRRDHLPITIMGRHGETKSFIRHQSNQSRTV